MQRIFKADVIENVGKNWLIADFGTNSEDNKHYILTTDHVHASEYHCYSKGAKVDAELVATLLNEHFHRMFGDPQERNKRANWRLKAMKEVISQLNLIYHGVRVSEQEAFLRVVRNWVSEMEGNCVCPTDPMEHKHTGMAQWNGACRLCGCSNPPNETGKLSTSKDAESTSPISE